MTEDAKTTSLKNDCLTLYGTFAASIVMLSFAPTLEIGLLGLLLLVIAYIMMLSKRKIAAGTFYASHLRWMNRTLWIGSGFLLLAMIISFFLIAQFTDMYSVIENVMSGNVLALQGYLESNMTKLYLFGLVPAIPSILWWVHRCWQGYVFLKQGLPVDNVTRWL